MRGFRFVAEASTGAALVWCLLALTAAPLQLSFVLGGNGAFCSWSRKGQDGWRLPAIRENKAKG